MMHWFQRKIGLYILSHVTLITYAPLLKHLLWIMKKKVISPMDGFVMIRRANDVSQAGSFIPSPQVGKHGDQQYGTHHARDAALLFETIGEKLNLFSSAMKMNTQYMHTIHFHLRVKKSNIIAKSFSKIRW